MYISLGAYAAIVCQNSFSVFPLASIVFSGCEAIYVDGFSWPELFRDKRSVLWARYDVPFAESIGTVPS